MSVVTCIAESLNELKFTRRFGFFFTLWITWISLDYSFKLVTLALTTNTPSLELAAIIAAILVPVTGLQGAVLKFYNKQASS
jgi:hypothetical protein